MTFRDDAQIANVVGRMPKRLSAISSLSAVLFVMRGEPFLVAFDLHQDGDYTSLKTRLAGLHGTQLLETVWAVSTKATARQLKDDLGPASQGIEDTLSHCPSKGQSLTQGAAQSRVSGRIIAVSGAMPGPLLSAIAWRRMCRS